MTSTLAVVVPDRSTDLAELGPIACTYCPPKYARRATFSIDWETVGYAIGGAERREICCDLCLADAIRFANEMNMGFTPPVISDFSIPAQRSAA